MLADSSPNDSIEQDALVFIDDVAVFIAGAICEPRTNQRVPGRTADKHLMWRELEASANVPPQPLAYLRLRAIVRSPRVLAEETEVHIVAHRAKEKTRIAAAQPSEPE